MLFAFVGALPEHFQSTRLEPRDSVHAMLRLLCPLSRVLFQGLEDKQMLRPLAARQRQQPQAARTELPALADPNYQPR